MLKKLLSEKNWDRNEYSFDEFSQSLPILEYACPSEVPGELSIYLLCRYTTTLKIEDFFLSFLKRKLIPYKLVEIISFRYVIRPFPLGKEKLFLAEAIIQIETSQDLTAIQHNFPLLSQVIASALHSSTYAHYLLETEMSHFDEKINRVHNLLFKLVKRFSRQFDADIFLEIDRLLILSPKAFRNQRNVKHITRLLCSLYIMGKALERAIRIFAEKRHLQLRFIPTQLQCPFGNKPVVGLAIAIYILDPHESFEEKHILYTIQKFLPDIQIVKGSFYCYQNAQEEVRKIYVELEKKNGSKLSLNELNQLRRLLSAELKGSVEQLAPSMLMVRNEEEALKNILILSNELNHIRDLPQMLISFEGQTASDLVFKALVVRIIRKNTKSLKHSFRRIKKGIKWSAERSQVVGYISQKYPKEASVIHLYIPKEPSILRADLSVNLYSARQKVIAFLEQAFGNIRDYHGGILIKQSELLAEIKEHFKNIPRNKLELLEEFFYGITPIEMQTILPIHSLVNLFNLFLESLEVHFSRQEQYYYKTYEEGQQTVFVVIRVNPASSQEYLESCITLHKIESNSVISTTIKTENSVCLGYIYKGASQDHCRKFLQAIELSILKWFEEIQKQQILRLNFRHLPSSLDPRLSGEQFAGIIFKMLYEGLMRIGKDGRPTCAIAKSVLISKDLKRYTFKLRKCLWSDGSRVCAQDFEYAWKKILAPNFKTAFAYLFYPIKNARFAKEGLISCEEIGIRAVNKDTLIVDLEHPTPYFLELTAHAFYSPINHKLDKIHPNWSDQEGDSYVCNGPFRVKKIQPNIGYELIKNETYWDVEEVRLRSILISKTNAYMALEMYQNDEIDWLGRPISPWEHFFDNHSKELIHSGPPGIIYWNVLNTECFPLNHLKLRQAMSLALDREEIIQSIAYPVMPAYSLLPLAQSQLKNETVLRESRILARRLFDEALQELRLKKEDLPIFTFLHMEREARKKVAETIINQWNKVLGIECRLESCEWSTLFTKLTQGDYQIGEMSWFSPINDPHYTLDAFKHKTNSVNFSKWENMDYQNLLDLAARASNSSSRLKYLALAEQLLLDQAFIIPLFYEADLYKKKPYLKEVYQRTEQVDFKWAYIERYSGIELFQKLNLANLTKSSNQRSQNETQ